MEKLSIHHLLLLEEPNLKLINLKFFKSGIIRDKATTYLNTNELLKYFRKNTFPAAPTMIIFKTQKPKSVIELLNTIRKVSQVTARYPVKEDKNHLF